MCETYSDHQFTVDRETPAFHVWHDSSDWWWYRVNVVCSRCGRTETHQHCMGKGQDTTRLRRGRPRKCRPAYLRRGGV
jgi:hypothetical protein